MYIYNYTVCLITLYLLSLCFFHTVARLTDPVSIFAASQLHEASKHMLSSVIGNDEFLAEFLPVQGINPFLVYVTTKANWLQLERPFPLGPSA